MRQAPTEIYTASKALLTMTYRELQTVLKNLRNAGYAISVKLTASYEILLAEYNRLTAITTQQPSCGNEPATKQPPEQLEVPPDGDITLQLGGNIKEPTENPSQQLEESRAIAQVELSSCKQADNNPSAQPTLSQGKAEPEPRGRIRLNNGCLRQNEVYKAQQNSESLVQQRFRLFQANSDSKDSYASKPLDNSLKVPLHKETARLPEPRGYLHNQRQNEGYSDEQNSQSLVQQELKFICINHPVNPYWIDGTQLGQKLDPTQVQALRNLEDGLKWVKRVYIGFKALAEGFAECGVKRSLKVA